MQYLDDTLVFSPSDLIIFMASSTVDDSARGIDFLFHKNRLNVAISRAQSLAFVVGNPALARTEVQTLEQMTQVNLFARLCELHALCPPSL